MLLGRRWHQQTQRENLTVQGRRHEPSPTALELSALKGLGNSQTKDGAIRFDRVREQLDIVTDFDLRRPDIVHPSRKPSAGPYGQ